MSRFEKVWRAFEDNEISHSAAHYLLAVESLTRGLGLEPKAADLARVLRVSRAAVSMQIQGLIRQGLLEFGEGKRLKLTPEGAGLVARIISKREVVRDVLSDILGVSPEVAELDGCKVEHLLSDESARALHLLREFLRVGGAKARAFQGAFLAFASERAPVRSGEGIQKIAGGAFMVSPQKTHLRRKKR